MNSLLSEQVTSCIGDWFWELSSASPQFRINWMVPLYHLIPLQNHQMIERLRKLKQLEMDTFLSDKINPERLLIASLINSPFRIEIPAKSPGVPSLFVITKYPPFIDAKALVRFAMLVVVSLPSIWSIANEVVTLLVKRRSISST